MEIVTSTQPKAMMPALAWRRKDVRSDARVDVRADVRANVRAMRFGLFIAVAARVKAVADVIRIEFP